jgi:hypothetical protein
MVVMVWCWIVLVVRCGRGGVVMVVWYGGGVAMAVV